MMYGALFQPGMAANGITSADQLQGALQASALPSASGSALEIGLAGGRRTSGTLRAGFSYSLSPRLQWSAELRGERVLRATSVDPAFAAGYPAVTIGGVVLNSTYSLTRRTQLGGSVEVSRSYSRLYHLFWQSASLHLERQLGRRTFVNVDGGYQRMGGIGTNNSQHSYSAAGGLGTRRGNHTLMMSGRRGIANLYGLPVSSTMSYLGAWSWSTPVTSWAIDANFSYEELRTAQLGRVHAAIYQMNLTRRLGTHFAIVVRGAYVANSSLGVGRSGLRLSCVWIPGNPYTRH
jgi:hypothetical protein